MTRLDELKAERPGLCLNCGFYCRNNCIQNPGVSALVNLVGELESALRLSEDRVREQHEIIMRLESDEAANGALICSLRSRLSESENRVRELELNFAEFAGSICHALGINAPGEDAVKNWPQVLDALRALAAHNAALTEALKESRRTHEMWKDVAPAVSLCADIDKLLSASPFDIQRSVEEQIRSERDAALQRAEEAESTLFEARKAILAEGIRSGDIERERDVALDAVAALRKALQDAHDDLANGFVRCETCGSQEDSATLDCMSMIIKPALAASPSDIQRSMEDRIRREALEELANKSAEQPYDGWPLCNGAGDQLDAMELMYYFETILGITASQDASTQPQEGQDAL